jgi:hypothetical protein
MSKRSSSSNSRLLTGIVGIIIAILVYFFGGNLNSNTGSGSGGSTGNSNPPASTSSGGQSNGQIDLNYQFGVQHKTSGCQVRGPLPDPDCTPGDIFPEATVSQICTPGYASSVRNVPTSEKDQVYASYGITTRTTGQYEVDHLVSLELGGSNDISNLFPEAAEPTPGFHQKDSVENYLHDQVCSGAWELRKAQIQIATNWLPIYQQMQGQ